MLLIFFAVIPIVLSVQLKTPFGEIKGFRYSTPDNFETDVFLGVRYAKAPIDSLRFEKPVMVDPWNNTYDASHFGASCFPHHRGSLEEKRYNEDCLFVNIVLPSKKKTEVLLPSIVYIHGGGYEIGNAETYGYKMASQSFVSNDIIFISIQYRVGFLGFFSTGDNVIPGNLGLWDQKLALYFIRKILPSLGGDVSRITLMGHSAGSSSITALMASPHSFNLFDQAIQLSGSALAEYGASESVVNEGLVLAKEVGCKDEDIKRCLQEKSVDEFLDATTILGGSRDHISMLKFHPRIDNDFITENLDSMLSKAPKKKTIQGLANQENFLFTLLLPNDPVSGPAFIPENRRKDFGRKDCEKFFRSTFKKEEMGEEADIFFKEVLNFYFGENKENSSFYINRFTELSSDVVFNIPVFQEIQIKKANDWETYAYVIDYSSEATRDPAGFITGTIHGGELRYMLEFYGQENIPLSDEDKRFQKALITAFVNFVKEGSPNIGEWSPIDTENDMFFHLNSESKMKKKFFREEAVDFWQKRLPKKVSLDTIKKLLPALQVDNGLHQEF